MAEVRETMKTVVTYLKKFFVNCKESILSKIGQNSIYIYFAQGIGASVLYWLLPYVNLPWYFKAMVLFAINLVVTAIMTVILKLVIEPIAKIFKRFLDQYAYNK